LPVREEDYRKLKGDLLNMASLVKTSISQSVRSLVERDSELARSECINLLALRQPMGKDLRFITTAMKITTDLERIADNSVNIAERALELNEEPQLKPWIDVPRMSLTSQSMVKDAIDAFVNEDAELAIRVIERDDEIDDLNAAVMLELMYIMTRDSSTISRAMKISYISKYLERIGDHATNIAEMVVYMVKGRIIRHMSPSELKKLEEEGEKGR
jgi:phosphate transport system protein